MKVINVFLIFIAVVLFVVVAAFSLFQISKSRTFQFFGELIPRVETDQKVIALTFDDAPTEYTNEVLNILREKGVKATFYLIGENIEEYPYIASEIIVQGHAVGNHSYSHKRFLLKSYRFIKTEIDKTNQLIKDLGYEKEITFRPPNGKKLFGLPWYLKQQNIKTIMWDVEPETKYQGNEGKIIQHTLENTKAGSIILMHPFCGDQCEASRKALPVIIDELKSEGYEFVTIDELLKF